MMREIRWHGRGGQGAKTVSEVVALALMHHGYFVQAFPEYGPERSGAPLQAYTRSSDAPIRLHCGVTDPDIVVVLDDSLIHEIHVTEGLKPGGLLLVNTKRTEEAIRLELDYDGKLYCIDADRIAESVNLPYSNVVMAGALGGILGNPPLEDLKQAGRDFLSIKLSPEIVEINLKGIEAGFRESQMMEETA